MAQEGTGPRQTKHGNGGQAGNTKTAPEARHQGCLLLFLAEVEPGYLILREDLKLGTPELEPC